MRLWLFTQVYFTLGRKAFSFPNNHWGPEQEEFMMIDNLTFDGCDNWPSWFCYIGGDDDGPHLHDLIQQLVCFLQVHLRKNSMAPPPPLLATLPHTIFPKHWQTSNKTTEQTWLLPQSCQSRNKLDHKHVSHNFYDSKPISLICLLTSILGWLVACSTRVSDTVLAMMFLQIRSTYGSGLSSWRLRWILMMITLLNFLPSTGICFMMSSLLKIGSR